MNTRVLTSWLMVICPIGMMVTFAGLDPLIMGAPGEGLGPNERVLAGLETFNDKKVAGYFHLLINGQMFSHLSYHESLFVFKVVKLSHERRDDATE